MRRTYGTCIDCGVGVSRKEVQRCRSCMGAKRRLVMRRSNVAPTPQATPCRTWQGCVDRDGYGLRGGQRLHRWVWEQANGTIPSGLVIMHLCDNPPCYRLDHLRLGTVTDNNRDREAKGRSKINPPPVWMWRSGGDHGGAKLDSIQGAAIQQRFESGEPVKALASEYGVGRTTIQRIVAGSHWSVRS